VTDAIARDRQVAGLGRGRIADAVLPLDDVPGPEPGRAPQARIAAQLVDPAAGGRLAGSVDVGERRVVAGRSPQVPVGV
jgi:hypothetical protein